MGDFILTSTLNDPDGRLVDIIHQYGTRIRASFDQAIIVVTPQTSDTTIHSLLTHRFHLHQAGKSRRETYTAALEQAINTGQEPIFHCDFDRLLHWSKSYPEEYASIRTLTHHYDFTLFGRTPRAFETHPQTQQETEGTINAYCSQLLHLSEPIDFNTATYSFTQTIARHMILNTTSDLGFYLEWALTGYRHAKTFKYLVVEGQEWETPDRYEQEIKKIGYTTWLKNWQTPEEWSFRKQIMRESIHAAQQFVSKKYINQQAN